MRFIFFYKFSFDISRLPYLSDDLLSVWIIFGLIDQTDMSFYKEAGYVLIIIGYFFSFFFILRGLATTV